MQKLVRQQRLSALQERIAAIEKRPVFADGSALPAAHQAATEPLRVLRQAPAGLLHEVYADGQRNGGAALGFALSMAKSLMTPARPAVLFMQLLHAAQDMGLPYGPGLAHYGIDPEQLVLARLATLPELLWAVEEAIACRAVAGVVAEVLGEPKILDFTVSRRLSLRAGSGGASVFLLRYGTARQASAARLRWRIEPAPSQPPPFDAAAPGSPRWRVTLEKGRLGPAMTAADTEYLVDWTEHGFQPADQEGADAARHGRAGAAPSGALPAALGDRLSQAG